VINVVRNAIRKYRKFQYKTEYIGRDPLFKTDDYGTAKMSIASRISHLEAEYVKEKNPIRKSAIKDVINSLRFLIK
jgi:hypothetical protein